jgi:CysZ protein
MTRIVGRFTAGFMLPLKGGLLLLRHRRLLALATVPLVLNLLLYLAALALVVHYYEQWFGLLVAQPQAWYWFVGYVVLRLVAFVLLLAALVFSFVFVGTALTAPFLEVLSAHVERLLRGPETLTFGRPLSWLRDLRRALGHALLLLLLWLGLFPLSFLPGLGHLLWMVGSWLLLAYNFTAFALEHRRWSFREQWRLLLREWAATLGFGAAVFVVLLLPLFGLVLLPIAAVGGTLLVLEIETQHPLCSRLLI